MLSIVTISRLMTVFSGLFWFANCLFICFGLPKVTWLLKCFHTVEWRYLESFFIGLGELSILIRIPVFIIGLCWIVWQISTLWSLSSREAKWHVYFGLCSLCNLFASVATSAYLLFMSLGCLRKAIDVTRMEPVEWLEVLWRFLQALF